MYVGYSKYFANIKSAKILLMLNSFHTDLDKLHLFQFDYCGFLLGSGQFSLMLSCLIWFRLSSLKKVTLNSKENQM